MEFYCLFSNEIKFENKIIRSHQRFMSTIGKGFRPDKIENIPENYQELIQKCWKQDPNERPTFDEIVEILKNDNFALEEFGMKTDMDELHRYQEKIDESKQ